MAKSNDIIKITGELPEAIKQELIKAGAKILGSVIVGISKEEMEKITGQVVNK